MLALSCACGAVTGTLAPGASARVTCYCDDCQAYARWLGRDDVLDAHGGTDVVQTWPSRVRLDGDDVALLRLSEKGLLRWYAACCRTPLANCLAHPRMPFIGVLTRCIVDRAALDPTFGPSVGVQGRFAPGGCPPGVLPTASVSVMAGAVSLLVRGALSGAHTPSPVRRDGALRLGWDDGARVLTPDERAALTPSPR